MVSDTHLLAQRRPKQPLTELDIEIEISYDLAQRVLQHEGMLVAVSDLCGELDCMLALAHGAHHHNLVRPRMTKDNTLDIKDGRHLLQEMTVPSYVTNDAFLVGGRGPEYNNHNNDEDNDTETAATRRSTRTSSQASPEPGETETETRGPSMLLLTGPNYSGKSVYLKSVAQIVYLAHLGSFVPCASAVIGLTDAILTRIRTCETVSRPHSAFMIDLQQVAMMLKMATRRSLVVIDEFGKGTDASDGAGLATGVLQHLLGRGEVDDAPKVLAATHFHEIFEAGYLPPQPGLAFAHMEVRVDHQGQHRSGTATDASDERADDHHHQHHHHSLGTAEVTYLYNLRPGRSNESFGTQCAAMNGVPAVVVERASQLSRLALQGEDLVSVCAGIGPREEEDLECAERVARRFLEWDLDAYADADAEGEDEGTTSSTTEQEDPRRILENVLGEVDGGGMESGTGTGQETGTRSQAESD